MKLKKYGQRKEKHKQLSCIRATVKFGGGNVMVLESATWNRTGNLDLFDRIIKSEVYVHILKKNLLASTRKWRMGKYFVFQQDNDPKHTSKKAKEFFIQKQIELRKWSALSPDFNPVEHQRVILGQKAGARCLKRKESKKLAESIQN